MGLAAQGPFEPFGIPIDLTNASISALRGNYGEAALGVSAAVPFVGIAANFAKVGNRAIDAVDVAKDIKPGSFSIVDWTGYPAGVPKPTNPVNLISGVDYEASRAAANSANRAIHQADPSISHQQIHEIQPVKFGGSPTDPANKVAVEPSLHYQINTWWKNLQRYIEGTNGR